MGSAVERFGRGLLRGLHRALPRASGGVTVLAYHLAGAGTGSVVDLPAELFARQLDELAESGRVVPLAHALERLAGNGGEERHRIVLTFDDAFGNFFESVWPLLIERRLPAVLYVPVAFVDGGSPSPLAGAERLKPMTWDQIREVAASGSIAIGSHSLSHPDLRRLPEAECRRELELSRRRLEEETGAEVASFCYPRALWSPTAHRLAAELYDSAVAAGGRRNRPGRFDRHRISRLPLRRDMPPSLERVLAKSVWLEEWAASGLRRLRP